MDSSNKPVGNVREELQKALWAYFLLRKQEIEKYRLTSRLTIEYNAGQINNIYDNITVAGVSLVDFYAKRVLD